MESARPRRQRQPRCRDYRHAIKVVACGGMIGSAILFPLANVEGLWFRAVTLSIFIISALGFHALHLEPFLRFGPYTVAAALIFLLVAVLSAGSSRRELIPWLPLFIASLSLVTVAMYEVSQHTGYRPLSFTAQDELSGVSIDILSNLSSRTLSDQEDPQSPFESNRRNPLYFARHGPSSRCSQQTGTTATELALSAIVGQCRPDWDAQTRSYFTGHTLPEPNSPEEARFMRTSQGEESGADRDGGLDLGGESGVHSDHGTAESSSPLLNPQRLFPS